MMLKNLNKAIVEPAIVVTRHPYREERGSLLG
jgi:hypothetical protein